MFKLDHIVKAWKNVYGEELVEEYPGFVDELYKIKMEEKKNG